MNEAPKWARIDELGSGGQSTVFLVRSPQRIAELGEAHMAIMQGLRGTGLTDAFVEALATRLRPDRNGELGALKLFDKVREDGAAPELRIKREIEILKEGHPGLPKLLDSDAEEKWMITEFFLKGTLDSSLSLFKGNPVGALKAFRTLVETVAYLHEHGIVHRDIKPHNIFIAEDGSLIPLGGGWRTTSQSELPKQKMRPRARGNSSRRLVRRKFSKFGNTGNSSLEDFALSMILNLFCGPSSRLISTRGFHVISIV
jgi:serine/threonine protein kinase